MRQHRNPVSSLFRSLIATIGRRRRDRRKPGPRVPRWLARKMGQDESTLLDDSVPPKTLSARTLSAVADYIKSGRAKRIVVLTGAGISTAAGIPDFRSPDTGLYSNLARLNLPYAEAVFDISYFREHPKPFYVLANELYPGKFHPTVSHVFIALLARKGLLQMLFTQNIDCLERAAGVPSEKIMEAHGSFATQRCIDCKTEYPDDKMKEHVFKGEVPRCEQKDCNGLVKPDIVFFGEPLPNAFEHNAYRVGISDLVLIIGTSLTVYPFAGLPEMAAPDRPRVLFNMERVGQLGRRADDVIELGSCDDGIRRLADELGWRDELEQLWRDVVGEKEADRQLESQKKGTNDNAEDEVQKLTREVESALRLDDTDHDDHDEGRVNRIARLMENALGPKYESKQGSVGASLEEATKSTSETPHLESTSTGGDKTIASVPSASVPTSTPTDSKGGKIEESANKVTVESLSSGEPKAEISPSAKENETVS